VSLCCSSYILNYQLASELHAFSRGRRPVALRPAPSLPFTSLGLRLFYSPRKPRRTAIMGRTNAFGEEHFGYNRPNGPCIERTFNALVSFFVVRLVYFPCQHCDTLPWAGGAWFGLGCLLYPHVSTVWGSGTMRREGGNLASSSAVETVSETRG